MLLEGSGKEPRKRPGLAALSDYGVAPAAVEAGALRFGHGEPAPAALEPEAVFVCSLRRGDAA